MVVLGLVGSRLDRGDGAARWQHWRPTVALCQQEDLLIRRLDLLCEQKSARLAQQITEDIRSVSPETEVWRANFRDLNASVTRMATLAPGGRITLEIVKEEIRHLQAAWQTIATPNEDDLG